MTRFEAGAIFVGLCVLAWNLWNNRQARKRREARETVCPKCGSTDASCIALDDCGRP